MAVDKMNEYAVQVAENTKPQQNCSTTGTNRNTAVDRTGKGKENQGSTQTPDQGEAVSYEVTKRTNDVAAWYQEFVLKEQEETIGTIEEEKTEKGTKKEEEEESAVKKKLKEAEENLKALQRMLEQMKEVRKKQQEEKKKNRGKLSYNYTRVSSAISSAKTSAQASNALTTATSNLSSLKRKAASGKYEDREIQLALQHAYKMVRIARKKVGNMKSEAMQKKKNDSVELQAKQQGKSVRRSPKKQKVDAEIAKLQKELRAHEKQRKNRNRRNEDMELFQADMQYLKRKLGMLQQQGYMLERNNMTSEDMIAAALGLTEVDMQETAVNAQESAGTEGGETAAVETAPAEAASVSGGFDVSV